MAYSEKVLDHYENPATSAPSARKKAGTGMVGAPACGDVMKLQIKVGKDGVIGTQVQDLRLRLGDRLELSGHRVGQGQDPSTRRARHQEHPDRRGAGAAAGQDPLLDPRQKMRSRPPWRTIKSMRPERPSEEETWLSRYLNRLRAASRIFIAKRGKGLGIRLGVKTWLFGHGLQARVRQPDGGQDEVFEPRRQGRHRPKGQPISTAPSSALRQEGLNEGFSSTTRTSGPVRVRRSFNV